MGTEFVKCYKKHGRLFRERLWFDGKDWWYEQMNRKMGTADWITGKPRKIDLLNVTRWMACGRIQRVA